MTSMQKSNKPGQIQVQNFYEQIPKKKNKLQSNPNFNIHGIDIPFRMLLVGASGSMKTNTALDIFQKFSGTFDHLTVVCRNKDEPLYNLLQEKIPDDQLTMVEIEDDDLSEMPTMDDMNSDSPHTLVIFDDLCLVKNQKAISEFFIRARKVNVSCMYLTQSYYAAPKTIRINCNYIILKKIDSIRDLQMILREYSLNVDVDQLSNLYSRCTQEKLDWLLIAMQNEPNNRFFHNYSHIDVQQSDSENTMDNSCETEEKTPYRYPASVKTSSTVPDSHSDVENFFLERYKDKF